MVGERESVAEYMYRFKMKNKDFAAMMGNAPPSQVSKWVNNPDQYCVQIDIENNAIRVVNDKPKIVREVKINNA